MSENCHKCKIAPAATGLILCAVCITKKHLRETLALEAQVKELKEKLSLAERNNIIAHERNQVAFKEGKSYGKKPNNEWRCIKDAPPIDGSDFLATDGDGVFTVCFHKDGFALSTLDEIVDGGGSPYHIEPRYPHITHWMKMPTPPTQEGEE